MTTFSIRYSRRVIRSAITSFTGSLVLLKGMKERRVESGVKIC
jgi:hypothetical protein